MFASWLRAIANQLGVFLLITLSLGLFSIVSPLMFTHSGRAVAGRLQAEAYVSLAQFAPWNIAERYVEIVFAGGDKSEYAEQQARQQREFAEFACSLHMSEGDCATPPEPTGLQRFYLSGHVPLPLRPITAFFDLLLHLLIDQGLIGFLVAALQIAMGAVLTALAIRRWKLNIGSIAAKLIGIPAGILILGSIAALPLWGLALIGMVIFKSVPVLGLATQGSLAATFFSWLGRKLIEHTANEALKKFLEWLFGVAKES